MATKTITVEEPTYGELEEIRINVGRLPTGDANGINIGYILKDNQGNQVGTFHFINVQFSELTGPQQTTLRSVITWALNQIKAVEGPFA